MKKKIIKSTLFAFLAILMVAPQALALEIFVDDYGTVRFYQGSVLGRDDDSEEDRDDDHEEDKDDDKEDDHDDDNDDDDDDDDHERERERERIEIRQSAPLKTLYSSSKKEIKFKSEDDGRYKIEVQDGDNKYKIERRSTDPSKFTKKEAIEAQSIDFSFPTDAKSSRSTEDRVDYFKDKYSQRTEVQSLDEEDREKAIEKRQEDYKKYLEKLQEERKDKAQERVEIRSRFGEGQEGEFEIKSGKSKAKLKGADFSYDTETGEVIVTTPSGQEHFLQHLPDQAIDRMTENGFFVDDNQEIEIETTEDGQVKYKSNAKKSKRFLGLFNRQVETEVVLDDLTGEIVETEAPATGLSSLLNFLSF
ncbi:MAG: hypothetical protein OEX81_03720 [Candidatus Pacebacteria bacterium]|nr:hypothetical protein [Candidatus Paceibacterota bacterium]